MLQFFAFMISYAPLSEKILSSFLYTRKPEVILYASVQNFETEI